MSDDSATLVACRSLSEDHHRYLAKACLADNGSSELGIVDVRTTPGGDLTHESATVSDLDDLLKLFSPQKNEPKLRVIFINQACSWMPLQVTQYVLSTLVDRYQMMSEFLELASSFCDRTSGIQEGDCYPVQAQHSQSAHEICYAYKYAEMKTTGGDDPWRVRQSGIYHRLDMVTRHSLLVILSPVPHSAFECAFREALSCAENRIQIVANPMLAHHMLLSQYGDGMQGYLKYIEEALEEIWGDAITSRIDEPLTVTHKNLSSVRFRESRLQPTLPLLSNEEAILDGIQDWLQEVWECLQLTDHMRRTLNTRKANLERRTHAYRQNVLFLLDRARTISYTIADLLTFQHQKTTQGQSHQMAVMADSNVDDSVNVRVITLLTLFYLPFSFIATVLGMNLFNFDTESRQLEISGQFWIYFCVAVPLTVITLIFWRWNTCIHQRRRKARFEQATENERHQEV